MRVRLGRAGHPGRPAVPAEPYRTPRAYDLLEVPATAGHRVLLQWERLGFPVGPVLAVPGSRGIGGGSGSSGGGGASIGAGPLGTRPGAGGGVGVGHSGGRYQFFVAAGTTASLAADLADLGFAREGLDVRAVTRVVAAEAALPPLGSPRWVREPDAERAATYPPARMLLGSLAYACRRMERAERAERMSGPRVPGPRT